MKRINSVLTIALAVGLLGACTEKKKSDIIITKKPVAKVKKGPQKMSDYEQTRDVEWIGANYRVVVKRVSSTDLPMLQLDEDTKYYDNKITVRILRKDGSEFFNRTFTKTDFAGYLD